MDDLITNPAFRIYGMCVGVLTIKVLLSAVYTGVQRQRASAYANAEDNQVFGQGAGTVGEHPDVAHALRIQRNDSENIPAFFAVGLVYVLSGATASGALWYCGLYTAARCGHTIAYTFHLQPWRALLFGVGFLAQLGMAFQVIF